MIYIYESRNCHGGREIKIKIRVRYRIRAIYIIYIIYILRIILYYDMYDTLRNVLKYYAKI